MLKIGVCKVEVIVLLYCYYPKELSIVLAAPYNQNINKI